MSEPTRLTIVSPERRARVSVLLASVAVVVLQTVSGGFRRDWYFTTVSIAVLALLAWRVGSTRVEVDGAHLVDVRALRRVSVAWSEIRRFDVGRCAGAWGGFCIRAELHDGSTVDLLATRVYSRVPVAEHVQALAGLATGLNERLAAARGASL